MPVVDGYEIPPAPGSFWEGPPPPRRGGRPGGPARGPGGFRERPRAPSRRARKARAWALGGILLLPLFPLLGAGMRGGAARAESALSRLEPVERYHEVRAGETLSGIAARHGMALDQLLDLGANRRSFPDPNLIRPGQKVELR